MAKLYLHECIHSFTVAASMMYPLHNGHTTKSLIALISSDDSIFRKCITKYINAKSTCKRKQCKIPPLRVSFSFYSDFSNQTTRMEEKPNNLRKTEVALQNLQSSLPLFLSLSALLKLKVRIKTERNFKTNGLLEIKHKSHTLRSGGRTFCFTSLCINFCERSPSKRLLLEQQNRTKMETKVMVRSYMF